MRWHRLVEGSWSLPDAIHNLECRAALLGLRRLTRIGHYAGHEALSIRDNLSEIVAIEKGRAKNWKLNSLCRKAAALQHGGDIAWRRRHIETKRNISDFDSRLAERGIMESGEVLQLQLL